MKKTISISIGGYSFQVEEDAYARLEKYLSGVKERFASYVGADEIVSDIEGRMAEQFTGKAGESKIVTLAIVEEMIAVMGQPEQMGGEDRATGHAGSATGSSDFSGKRFYRSLDNAMLGGVASGIAAYFGDFDPLWVRLAFALSVFFGGLGVVLYLILWIIVPAARTDTEKMQMRGEPVNLRNIEETVKARVDEVKNRDYSGFKKILVLPFRFLGAVIRAAGSVSKNLFSVVFRIVGFFLTVAAALAIAGIVVALVSILFNANSSYLDFPIREVASGAMLYMGVTSGFFVAFVPLVFLMLLGTSLLSFRSSVSKMSGFSLLAIWIIAVAVFAGVATRVAPEVASSYRDNRFQQTETRQYDVKDFREVRAGDAFAVKVSRGDEYKVTATGRANNLDDIGVRSDNGALVVDRGGLFRFCVFCFNRRVSLEVVMPQLTEISASGASQFEITGFEDSDLSVKLSGASRLTLSGAYDAVKLGASGASKVSAGDAAVKNADLDLSGASTAAFGDLDVLKVRATGASKVYYGSAKTVEQHLSGASRVIKTPSNIEDLD